MNIVREWLHRNLSDPQVVSLGIILLGVLALIILFGSLMAPVIASVILAYFLEGPVRSMERLKLPRGLSAGVLALALLLGVVVVLFALVPLLTRQAAQVFQEIPSIIANAQAWMLGLPERYPSMITIEQVEALLSTVTKDIGSMRQLVVSRSVVVGVGLIYMAVYLVLVPLMVFFFLRDKEAIIAWMVRFVPRNQGLVRNVWSEVDVQLANYIRGKVIEILLVWVAAYLLFTLLGLKYAMLLSALVGLSVLVPYLGALAMTIPIAIVAYAQWGLEAHTLYVLVAYTVLQVIDGNLLVPLLFSEAVNLHPVAIIAAVLFFGGVWGFWGVFFAIPLATVVHAVINAWPRKSNAETTLPESTTGDAVTT